MQHVTVEMANGTLKGMVRDGVRAFLGVPYAAPPVGERRFAAPAPAAPWTGVRDATRPGPTAPQIFRVFPGIDIAPMVGGGWVEGDDYLTANIWTPDGDPTGLPVMVWLHGGGFIVGSKDVAGQDGGAFARDGVILVAINYRLGVEGFLPIPGVPTNLGLRDILFALAWVRDTIAAFGGDPANVTLFGQSAGAMAAANLITSPLAKGLFRRAIVQSGHGGMTRDIGVAQRLVRTLAGLLEVRPDAAGFASRSAADHVAAVESVSRPAARLDLRDAEGREPLFGISRFAPVHGDDIVPERPLDALKKGAGAGIDLLIGASSEEMNLYLVPTGVREKLGALLSIYLLHRSQPHARRALKAYGMGQKGVRPGHALTRAMTDLVFRWPARRFAEEHRGRTHMYEFDWRSPLYDGQLGACHWIDVPFIFDNLDKVTGPESILGQNPPQALADSAHKIWVDYAKDGTLPWPAFDRNSRQVYRMTQGAALFDAVMPAAPFAP